MDQRRRHLLALAALVPLAPLVPRLGAAAGRDPGSRIREARLLSPRSDGRGGHRLTLLGEDGSVLGDTPLPGRGHGMALSPDGRHAVCLARRPGDFLLLLDLSGAARPRLTQTPENRHLYGHGVFSRDGTRLYTTEHDLDSDRGRIGIWELADGLHRLGDLPSHGIGPHELLLSADGRQLIVANGGILTRPETGRAKLNLDTMAPSLVFLDRATGTLIETRRLPADLHRLSIRHLALGRGGILFAAMQFEGPADRRPPLVAMQRPGEELVPLQAPDPIHAAMRNYCGSVVADRSGDWFAVSAPRGNLVSFWGADGTYRGHTQVTDGCGVAQAQDPGTFHLSSGTGTLYRHDCLADTTTRLRGTLDEGTQWDNHLVYVGADDSGFAPGAGRGDSSAASILPS